MAQVYNEPASTNGSMSATGAAPKQTYRSFKKKYAKLKIKFELGVRESEALIREELRIQDLSKRIQEQNDQLLEVLLEFNDSLHLPPYLRYDLSLPGDPISRQSYKRNEPNPSYPDVVTATAALSETRTNLTSGKVSPESYRHLEEAVKGSKPFEPRIKYQTLLRASSTTRPASAVNLESTLGYLTPEHETEFYLALDARLGDKSAVLQLSHAPEKPSLAEREREAALRNPISVNNWLRRNQPQVFLQDNEIASEKSVSRPVNLRSSKRASTQVRKEEDAYDEDGVLIDQTLAPGSSKGKRKRDDDAQYRPKGASGRGGRKKKDKEDTAPSNNARRSKRSSGGGA